MKNAVNQCSENPAKTGRNQYRQEKIARVHAETTNKNPNAGLGL